MSLYRAIIGFIIAPLVVPLFFAFWHLMSEERSGEYIGYVVGALVIYAPYAYMIALCFGMPALLLMNSIKKKSILSYIITGVIMGLMPCILFYYVLGIRNMGFYFMCILSAGTSAAVFWFVVYGKSR